MNMEKWKKIFHEESKKHIERKVKIEGYSPENWELHKDSLLQYIKGLDEATEVFNMENTQKKDRS